MKEYVEQKSYSLQVCIFNVKDEKHFGSGDEKKNIYIVYFLDGEPKFIPHSKLHLSLVLVLFSIPPDQLGPFILSLTNSYCQSPPSWCIIKISCF
jgi:hypothetical protein